MHFEGKTLRFVFLTLRTFSLLCLLPKIAFGAYTAIYASDGNDGYQFTGSFTVTNLKNDCWNGIIMFAASVQPNGDITAGGNTLATNGTYTGDSNWGANVSSLKSPPTAVTRYELCVGGWGDTSYANIQNLINAQGTGSGSILYRNFQALKNACPGLDAINDDDEGNYDLDSSVAFGWMLNALGLHLTQAPYMNQSFWVSLKNDLGGVCDIVYLQCYQGGAGNDPGQWDSAYGGGFHVVPGEETNYASQAQFATWAAADGVTGGFFWPDWTWSPGTNWETMIAAGIGTNCGAPPPVTPYLNVNGGGWQQAASASVPYNASVNLGPQSSQGSWTWSGPDGFAANSREIDAIPLLPGTNTFTATNTTSCVCQNTQTFTITMAGPPSCGNDGMFGNNAAATGGYNLAGQLNCAVFTLAYPLSVTNVQLYMATGSSGSGVAGIYSDNAGKPGTLLAQSGVYPIDPGWDTFDLPPTTLNPGTYWLAGSFTGNAVFEYSANPGGMDFEPYAFTGTLPSTVGGTTGYGWDMCAVATGCRLPTPTPSPTPWPSGSGTGVCGQFFSNVNVSGLPCAMATDAQIDLAGAAGAVSGCGTLTTNYSIRWTGLIEAPESETFTLYTATDDGTRLWITNPATGQETLLINEWVTQGATEWSATLPFPFVAGTKYPFRMEYFQGCCAASANLEWSSPNTPKATIPANRLYLPAAGCVLPTPTTTPYACGIWVTNGNAFNAGSGVTLTTAANSEAGSAWNAVCINLSQDFNMSFQAYFGAAAGADGMDFVLQNDPRGTAALGAGGGNKGYSGASAITPSMAFDLETYSSNGTLRTLENGNTTATCGYVQGSCPYIFPATVTDNAEHSFQVAWSAASKTLNLYFDGRLVDSYQRDLVASVFGGNSCVFYGFTAGTGGSNNLQYFYESSCAVPTATGTQTPTLSSTPTATPTATLSSCPTVTQTATGTQTPTCTSTNTITPSPTATESPSQTQSGSVTLSPTPSSSSTATPTGTQISSPSATPTPSQTITLLVTNTLTPSPWSSTTASFSVSPSASPSASPLVSASASAPVTATPSLTATVAPPSSPSATRTPAAQPSASATCTSGGNATATALPSVILNASSSAPGIVQIDQGAAQPNPNPRSIRFHLMGEVDDVIVKSYTVAMVCQWEAHAGPQGPGWAGVNLGSLEAGAERNGVYFVSLTPMRHGIAGSTVVLKIAVLR